MVNFRNNYILTALFIALFTIGCNFTDTSSNSVTEKASVNSESASAVNSQNKPALKEEKPENSLFRQKRDADEQQTLADGSKYVKMQDAYGNAVEFRYFEGDNPVKYISVQTLVDGTKSMIIRMREGSIKRIKPTQIENPWRTPLREIALLAGVSAVNNFHSQSKSSSLTKAQSPVQLNKQNSKIKTETPLNSSEALSKESSNDKEPGVFGN